MGLLSKTLITVLLALCMLLISTMGETSRDKADRLWTDAEFSKGEAITKEALNGGPPVMSKQKSINVRPPFYKGKLPLTYAVKEWGYPGIHVTLSMDFTEWSNEFIYLDINKKNYVMANGARAKERISGRVVAEAKLIDPFIGTPRPILVEEFHYGEDGKAIFKCKSYFNKDTGFKESETTILGRKVRDYFLIWPMGQ